YYDREAAEVARKAEQAVQCDLLRDLFGNPLGPLPPLGSSLLTWDNGIVVNLARAAYDDRRLPEGTLDPARLAALADTLEESGLADADLLGHLRGPGPHWGGCHAVDWLLGKT